MKRKFQFTLLLLSVFSFSLSSQTGEWNSYNPNDSCSRLIYSVSSYNIVNDSVIFSIWNNGRDTILSPAEIKRFYIQNPSRIFYQNYNHIKETLEKLTNVEELFFYGDDSDSFKGLTENEFEKFVISKKLTKIHIRNVDATKHFEKYIRKKHKNISIIKS
ncbi:MAG: hypothetical protein IAF38_02330 [Bacteroidia bacterium]|nr:hypothetical protein [Bacteroidia bacterium]